MPIQRCPIATNLLTISAESTDDLFSNGLISSVLRHSVIVYTSSNFRRADLCWNCCCAANQ
jgi:hypothetical protein